MAQLQPQTVIRMEYGTSRNFITPGVIEYGWIVVGSIAYELSTGEGYGVSLVRDYGPVVRRRTRRTRRMHRLSKHFYSRRAARDYVSYLRRRFNRKED